jgi:hypothetical protein
LPGATSNPAILGTQPEFRHQLVHRNPATAATKHITLHAHLKIVCKTGSSKNKKQHAAGCGYIHIGVNGGRLTVICTAGARRELHNDFFATCNAKPPWSTKAFAHTVHEIKHHDVVTSGIFADNFADIHPREWTNQAVNTLEEATEAYMVEVIAEFHCEMQ